MPDRLSLVFSFTVDAASFVGQLSIDEFCMCMRVSE